MKRILVGLLLAVVLARFYDLHIQQPEAPFSQLVTMLAPIEIWLAGIVLWSAVALLRRYL